MLRRYKVLGREDYSEQFSDLREKNKVTRKLKVLSGRGERIRISYI